MQQLQGRSARPPIIAVHAGARALAASPALLEGRRAAVRQAIEAVWPRLRDGLAAVDAATEAVAVLEADPWCNAGYGAVLQRDGMARLSASLMDGARGRFSGVMLATHLKHPSRLARALQTREESVLGPLGAQLLARELGIPPEYPASPEVARQWAGYLGDADRQIERSGTVGAVVMDREGRLAAATSTGGSVINQPERVSDSATVAGNYASLHAAISCTGVGEQIVDDGLAVRLETRVRDGLDMIAASQRVLDEAVQAARAYGWIGLDAHGNWVMHRTTEAMPCAIASADRSTPLFA